MTNAETRKRLTQEIEQREEELQALNTKSPCCGKSECFEDAAWIMSVCMGRDKFFCELHARQDGSFVENQREVMPFWVKVADYEDFRAEVFATLVGQ